MIKFHHLDIAQKEQYEALLKNSHKRGCEYNFNNLYFWGRQRIAFHEGNVAFFSQFDRKSVYPFPLSGGNLKPTLDAIIHDASVRDIPCRLTGLSKEDCDLLEQLYPGKFRFHNDRDGYDYVYAIEDLAELKGRKFQKKRNHLNRFLQEHPDFQLLELDESTRAAAYCMLQTWYAQRAQVDPTLDFHLEKLALDRAFAFQKQLGLEGVVLMEGDRLLAFAMGSFLNEDTFDIHFEKAREDVPGAYNAINREFARYLRSKYPQLKWLNREDDLGLEGLRTAKLGYNPDHLVEKYWARLWEDEDEA